MVHYCEDSLRKINNYLNNIKKKKWFKILLIYHTLSCTNTYKSY